MRVLIPINPSEQIKRPARLVFEHAIKPPNNGLPYPSRSFLFVVDDRLSDQGNHTDEKAIVQSHRQFFQFLSLEGNALRH